MFEISNLPRPASPAALIMTDTSSSVFLNSGCRFDCERRIPAWQINGEAERMSNSTCHLMTGPLVFRILVCALPTLSL
jgi:hypothetical protein